ncbi:MAG: RRXRR domain-containing protein [Nitrospirota bacterium]
MLVFTKDRLGNSGHPTKRFDQIRKLLKKKQIRIIGGGASKKPVVVVFLNKEFDLERTVNRRFAQVITPGYNTIGFAVCEIKGATLIVLCRGRLKTRTPDIRGLMQERRSYRRLRRYLSRYRKRGLSARQGRVLTKFKKPRNIRPTKKISATLQHGVNAHINLFRKMHKLCPLPEHQISYGLEDNVFDVRTMTWGPTDGKGYQESPRKGAEVERKCIVCGFDKDVHRHHLIQKKKGGTEVLENKVYLCKSCHEDVHAWRIYLPINGIKQWRSLGTMNAISGMLRDHEKLRTLDSIYLYLMSLMYVPAPDMAASRTELGLPKGHDYDAVASAASLFNSTESDFSQEIQVSLRQFRRHNRSRTHALRDRLYKLDGRIVARNRNKKTDQKEDSLAEFRGKYPELVGRLKVYTGIKVPQPFRRDMPAIGGDMWKYQNKRFVADSVLSGKYIYSAGLKDIIGKPYINPALCRRIIRNEGMVVV